MSARRRGGPPRDQRGLVFIMRAPVADVSRSFAASRRASRLRGVGFARCGAAARPSCVRPPCASSAAATRVDVARAPRSGRAPAALHVSWDLHNREREAHQKKKENYCHGLVSGQSVTVIFLFFQAAAAPPRQHRERCSETSADIAVDAGSYQGRSATYDFERSKGRNCT